MELDRAGNVVITSMTRSRDVPTTDGCFQPEHGGGRGSIFVAKLSPDLKAQILAPYDNMLNKVLALDQPQVSPEDSGL